MKTQLQNWTFAITLGALASGSLMFAGCGGPAKEAKEAKGHDVHDHPSDGPHKGQLIELGNEEYHAELVHDDATHTVTIYLLDSKAKAAVPTPNASVALNLVVDGKPAQYTLPAKSLDGEPAGQSSRFESSDEKLAEALDAKGVSGRLKVTIAGKDYSGEIKEHKHD